MSVDHDEIRGVAFLLNNTHKTCVYFFVPASEKFEIYAISMLLANQRAKVYCNTDNYKKPFPEISSKC